MLTLVIVSFLIAALGAVVYLSRKEAIDEVNHVSQSAHVSQPEMPLRVYGESSPKKQKTAKKLGRSAPRFTHESASSDYHSHEQPIANALLSYQPIDAPVYKPINDWLSWSSAASSGINSASEGASSGYSSSDNGSSHSYGSNSSSSSSYDSDSSYSGGDF